MRKSVFNNFLCVAIFILLINVSRIQPSANWRWNCVENKFCIRVGHNSNNLPYYSSLEVCRLVCGDGSVWPKPTGKYFKSKNLIPVNLDKLSFKLEVTGTGTKQMLDEMTKIFRNNLQMECGTECNNISNNELQIIIKIDSTNTLLNMDTIESYKILSQGKTVKISAENVYGARNGLETLSHLFASYKNGTQNNLVTIDDIDIIDSPKYSYRSLLIDTARNYLDVKTIKRQIDGMAASKLNVLHWHITDSQSFPYISKRVPNLSKYGAVSNTSIYTPENVSDLILYARLRGVRIIMEIDAPAHAGNGWQWGPEAGLGNLGVCINQDPWRLYCIQPPCGQLNPVNKHTYNILSALYQDIIEQFSPIEMFHMGGDEVFIPCWNSSEEIISYLKSKEKGQSQTDFLDLWSEFQDQVLRNFDHLIGHKNTSILLWSSELTSPAHIEKYLDKNRYIIETWVPSDDPLPQSLLDKGYRLIISTKNAWYLDHGFRGNTLYYTWRTVYQNKLYKHKNVLGGEVCVWGEVIDENLIDSRIWPRAAAASERLWSNPSTGTADAEARMNRHRHRLVRRGIQAEALGPTWCYQNEGQCL